VGPARAGSRRDRRALADGADESGDHAFENLWIVDLAQDGRASAFIEWCMQSASKPEGPNG
jgi:hypothetical protein